MVVVGRETWLAHAASWSKCVLAASGVRSVRAAAAWGGCRVVPAGPDGCDAVRSLGNRGLRLARRRVDAPVGVLSTLDGAVVIAGERVGRYGCGRLGATRPIHQAVGTPLPSESALEP